MSVGVGLCLLHIVDALGMIISLSLPPANGAGDMSCPAASHGVQQDK